MIKNWWVGGDSNPGPTPKAFGAALPSDTSRLIQQINRDGDILLSLQFFLQFPRRNQIWHLAAGDEFQWESQSCCGVRLAPLMFTKAALQIGS